MLLPHDGEMGDFNVTPIDDSLVIAKYGLEKGIEMKGEQLYRDNINHKLEQGYTILIALFFVSMLIFIASYKQFPVHIKHPLSVVIPGKPAG